MRRMIDFLREERWHPPAWSEIESRQWDQIYQFRLPYLKEAQVFVIDNVAEFVLRTRENSKVSQDDLPCVAPPYPNFFMEWKDPDPAVKERYPLMGVHFREQKEMYQDLAEFMTTDEGRQIMQNTEYVLTAELYVTDSRGVPSGPLLAWILLVDQEGKMLNKPHAILTGVKEGKPANEKLIYAYKVMSGFLAVPLFALCFLHCKNVVRKTIEPPPRLSKKHQRKHGTPLTKYKILEIEPLKKILKREGKSEETGIKHAIHLCRGHFKNFREGRGLFGKHKGMYFWHPQVRGSKEKGVVLKEYKIKEPQKTT